MSMANEAGILLAYAIGMFGLFVVVCMFIVPLKYAVRFLISSLLGGIAIVVINLAGAAVGIHISLELPDRGSGRSLGRARGADAAVFPEHMTMT